MNFKSKVVFLFLLFCGIENVHSQGDIQKDAEDAEIFRLLSNLGADKARLKYLFREVDLVDSQSDSLITLIKKSKRRLVDKQAVISDLKGKLFSEKFPLDKDSIQADVDIAVKEFEVEVVGFVKKFRDILLEHQLADLFSALKMRRYLKATGAGPFEFPLYSGVKLTDKEKDQLKIAIEIEKQRMDRVEKELRSKAWKKILKSIPEPEKDKFEKLLKVNQS